MFIQTVILTLSICYAISNPTPVVLWHGMGDSCCNPLSMGYIKRLIEQNIPGVYVLSLQIGKDIIEDTENGFFMNVNKQIEYVCEKIKNDPDLANGYHAIGFSQGAQFLRGLAQRCPGVKNLISVGGQHQGVYGLPHCSSEQWICDDVRRLLNIGAYIPYVQNSLVQAEYWHDPLNEHEYREKSIFLADINNENTINKTYIENLLKIENLLLIKFTKDTMVIPKESEWFGYYDEGQTANILLMNETRLYKEDRIGLKQLNEDGRVHFLEVKGDHLRIPQKTFIKEVINRFLKT